MYFIENFNNGGGSREGTSICITISRIFHTEFFVQELYACHMVAQTIGKIPKVISSKWNSANKGRVWSVLNRLSRPVQLAEEGYEHSTLKLGKIDKSQ